MSKSLKNRITGRCWAFVMYPESMPSNWKDILIDTGLPCAISPLHDMDFEPTGEVKKSHYHVIVYYNNPTTFNNVKTNVCDKLNATIPIKLESMRGMYRYHLHLDNPEKFQYDDRDRLLFNGFSVDEVSKLTKCEILKFLREVFMYCDEHNIIYYNDLIRTCIEEDLTNFLEVIVFNAYPVKAFLDSKRYKMLPKKES